MKVKLISGNTKKELEKRVRIVSSAGMLSRSKGTVSDVIASRKDFDKNINMSRKIVGFGHKSIAEHDYLVFALENVTPIVEQALIGYRLTSFTIKSRRNVDFRNVGFYIPDFRDKNGNILSNNEELKDTYVKYMQSLFDKYGDLADEELPIEDCRFILPYSYYSNIIMGCDAGELLRITSDLLYGRYSNIGELHALGLKFEEIIREHVPYLDSSLDAEKEKKYYGDKLSFLDELVKSDLRNSSMIDGVKLTSFSVDADSNILYNVLKERYQISYEEAKRLLERLSNDNSGINREIMQALIHSKDQRELEQVSFSFEFPISLASLTHLTRHRTHSLLVPDFTPLWNFQNYVIPDSLRLSHESDYRDIFTNNELMVDYFKQQGVRDEDLVYFYLSGNTCNVATTMNGKTLEWISRMRCCNKAQWEIRNILNEMVGKVSEVAPLYGEGLGPTCKVEGYCPEGKDSCKNRGVVVLHQNK